MDGSGSNILAGTVADYLYFSNDYGGAWTQLPGTNYGWKSVKVPYSGMPFVACNDSNTPYLSYDGYSWVTRTLSGTNTIGSAAVSHDGSVIMLTGYGTQLFVSRDYGASFTAADVLDYQNWCQVSLSSTGNRACALSMGTYSSLGVYSAPSTLTGNMFHFFP